MTDIGEENQDSILVKAGLFLVILGLNLTLATIPPATNFCETLYELIGHFEFHRHRPGLVDSFSRMGTVIFVPAKRRNSVLSGILCYLAYKACNLNSPYDAGLFTYHKPQIEVWQGSRDYGSVFSYSRAYPNTLHSRRAIS
ncbi:hypothetical protein RF11_07428 [Thelohanellus kitauei]|uniref:Uncharacterized protein n=1 Tax=Thelohanellus kitauei TaxID=669202 RepID=A0A0C2N5J4_THEKT|nr:hypothetical protein RF11_07428 [Thelohanellus kitauei]